MSIKILDKAKCCGCEACVQVCSHKAVKMSEDAEGFRYPVVDSVVCVECGLCEMVCQYDDRPLFNQEEKYVFGGYIKDPEIRFESTSGGAFSAIVEAYCDEDYVVFGAKADGINVYHTYIEDKGSLSVFRKSKYSQSIIGESYKQVRSFLKKGKKVLFSGTPCQIAGLRSYLRNFNQDRLMTVEVICEGVPSPLYVRKWDDYLRNTTGAGIASIDYRYTGKALFQKGKWDFEQVAITLNGQANKEIVRDRWFNPFWSIWLNHLMSRPSCYRCLYNTPDRVADISMGDLWGVHLYCPDLYGKNGGSSLVVCNTEKGKKVFRKAQSLMFGHELSFEDALRYQSPMRKNIAENPARERFMADLQGDLSFKEINRRWAKKPTMKLLWQKYIWGNRQKIFFWELKKQIENLLGII